MQTRDVSKTKMVSCCEADNGLNDEIDNKHPLRLYLVEANRFDADLQHSDPVAASIAPSCCNLMNSVVKGGVLKIFAESDCSGLLRFV